MSTIAVEQSNLRASGSTCRKNSGKNVVRRNSPSKQNQNGCYTTCRSVAHPNA